MLRKAPFILYEPYEPWVMGIALPRYEPWVMGMVRDTRPPETGACIGINRHVAPGINIRETSIRAMRGKGGFLTAQRTEY